MKKIFVLIALFSISLMTLAQKNELKAVGKALDGNQFSEALSLLKTAEPLVMADSKGKYTAQYYMFLGKAYYANGTMPENAAKAASAFNKVVELEKSGSKKYSEEAGNLLNNLIQDIASKGSTLYDKANGMDEDSKDRANELFGQAAGYFEQVYRLSPRDTTFYQNAAYVLFRGGQYQKSIDMYNELLGMGYTGSGTTYTATSTVNEQVVGFASKEEMDRQVKMGLAKDPKVNTTEPQTVDIMKMISKGYISLEQNDKALEAIAQARELAPSDYGLLVDEAYVYYNMGDKEKFRENLEKAISIKPDDYILHYNIGVMKGETGDINGAISSYNKAIELNPKFANAYSNLGAVILDKAKPIVEEMNNSLSDFDKYDRLQAQQLDVYREALPYYEKAYEIDAQNINTVQTLIGIYEQLEMYDKSKALKAVRDQLK
jgi:tetratricopeptide (TPR) repeat protein